MMLNIHKNVEGLNRVNGISTPLLDNWISNGNPTSQVTLSKRCDNVTFSLLQRNNFTF
jgi:hypothetical protein